MPGARHSPAHWPRFAFPATRGRHDERRPIRTASPAGRSGGVGRAAALFATYVYPAYAQEGSAPDKPRGLNATAAHDAVTLTWDDPGDNSITGYVVLRRNRDTDAKGHFDVLAADTGTAATTYTDNTVAAETRYTYRIKAINEHGTSERSRWYHIDTPAAPEPVPSTATPREPYAPETAGGCPTRWI